jgi:hypothetical protein
MNAGPVAPKGRTFGAPGRLLALAGPAPSSPTEPLSVFRPKGRAEVLVKLTAAERALLLELVNFYATDVGDEVRYALSLEALEAAIVRAQLQARLWRAHQEGTLELDAEVLALLAKHHADCLRYVKDEHAAVTKLRAGDMDWCSIGMTPAESERETLGAIDSALEEIGPCKSLLARAEAA